MKNIKSISASLLVPLLFVMSGFTPAGDHASTQVQAMNWNIDKAHSNISFEVRHFFTPVTGKFKDYSSDINFDPHHPDEGSIDIEIMVSSISTDNERRDGHLQSDDFFGAETYPAMTFSSNKITQSGNNNFIAHGKLTIKDVTKDIELPFTLLGIQDHPRKENTKIAGVKIDYTLNRNEYHVGTGSWTETTVVGDEVDISIALEMQHTAQ